MRIFFFNFRVIFISFWTIIFKVGCSICIIIPRTQPEVGFFWCCTKALIFLIITPKFQLQIHYTLKVIAENVSISGIPILIFLLIFMTASSPVSCTVFAPREKLRSNLEVKLHKMYLRVKVSKLRVKKYTFENGHIPLKFNWYFTIAYQTSPAELPHQWYGISNTQFIHFKEIL